MFDYNSTMNTIILGSFMILVLYLTYRTKSYIARIPYPFLMIYTALIFLRLCWPFDRKQAFMINIRHIYPAISSFLVTKGHWHAFHFYYYQVLAVIWIAGSILCLIRIIRNHICFSKLLKIMPKKSRDDIRKQYRNRMSASLYQRLTIIQTDYVSTPSVARIRHPVILLPEMEFSDKELEYIISHELQHIRNHDLVIQLFTELLCALYWWNPLVYLLKKVLININEIRIDSILSKNWDQQETHQYISCLLKVSQHQANTGSDQKLIAFAARQEPLVERTAYLKKDGKQKIPVLSGAILAITMFCSITCMFVPYQIPPEVESESFTIPADDSYIVKNNEGTYTLYINHEPAGTLTDPYDSAFEGIPVYQTLKEAKSHEKN